MKRSACRVVLVGCLIGAISCGSGTSNRNAINDNLPPVITATSGISQSHSINGAFGLPMVATVTTNGSPTSGVAVTFTAPATGASGTFAGGVDTAITDSNGIATSPTFKANGFVGSYTVTASSSGITAPASFKSYEHNRSTGRNYLHEREFAKRRCQHDFWSAACSHSQRRWPKPGERSSRHICSAFYRGQRHICRLRFDYDKLDHRRERRCYFGNVHREWHVRARIQ